MAGFRSYIDEGYLEDEKLGSEWSLLSFGDEEGKILFTIAESVDCFCIASVDCCGTDRTGSSYREMECESPAAFG